MSNAEIAALEVRIQGNLDALEKKLDDAVARSMRAGGEAAEGFAKRFGERAKQLGDAMSVTLTLPIVLAARKAVEAARDVGEAQNAAQQVFKESAAVVEQFAQRSATAFGISRRAAYEYTATLGGIYKASGLSGAAAAGLSVQTVKLAADLASLKNLRIEDALEKIRSGLVGQQEPLQSVGVLLSEKVIAHRAEKEGIKASYDQLSEGTKVQLRFNEILAQTVDAQGDFGRTSKELANQQRILTAEIEDLAAKAGQDLLPVAKDVVGAVREWAKAIGSLDTGQRRALGWLLVTLAVGGPVLSAVGRLAMAWAAVTTAAQQAAAAQAGAAAAGSGGAAGLLGRVGGALGGLALGYLATDAVVGSMEASQKAQTKAEMEKLAKRYNELRKSGPVNLDTPEWRKALGTPGGAARGLLPRDFDGQGNRYENKLSAVLRLADEMLKGTGSGSPGGGKGTGSGSPGGGKGKKGGAGRGGRSSAPELSEEEQLRERLAETLERERRATLALKAARVEDQIAYREFGRSFAQVTDQRDRRLIEGLALHEKEQKSFRDGEQAKRDALLDAERAAREAARERARASREAVTWIEREVEALGKKLDKETNVERVRKGLQEFGGRLTPEAAAVVMSMAGEADKRDREKRDKEFFGKYALVGGQVVPRRWLEQAADAEKGMRQKAAQRFESEMQALADRAKELTGEQGALEVRTRRLAESFGVGATAADRIKDGMARAKEAVAAALDVERIERSRQALERLADDVEGRFMQMFDGLLRDGFGNFFNNVLAGFRQMVADMAREWISAQVRRSVSGFVTGLVGGLFGGGSGGGAAVGGSFLGGSGGFGSGAYGGARAAGGPVDAGTAYLVGERGAEMFVPSSPGQVVAAGAVSVVVNVNTPDAGSFLQSEGQVAAALGRAVSRAMRRSS